MASSSFDRTVVLHPLDRSSSQVWTDFRGGVRSVSFSADSQWLAANGTDYDPRVILWNTANGEKVYEFTEQASNFWPCSIAWSPKEMLLATLGQKDLQVRIWRVNLAETLRPTA